MAAARPRASRGDRARKLLLDAALDCFSAYGFEGASMRLIAERAQISPPLLMYHFDSKENLWAAALEDIVGHYVEHIRDVLAENHALTATETLKIYLAEYIKLSAEKPQLLRIMTQQSIQESDKFEWLLDKFLRRHFELITDLIRRAQLEGNVRAGNPAQLYYFIISSISTPFTAGRGYKILSGSDIFSDIEMKSLLDFVTDILFLENGG